MSLSLHDRRVDRNVVSLLIASNFSNLVSIVRRSISICRTLISVCKKGNSKNNTLKVTLSSGSYYDKNKKATGLI